MFRILLFLAIAAAAYPQLLLNTQRIRRLQRDQLRKTVRWTNFETRVKTVPDSPERAFELALYYAITKDEASGKEAIQWALSHPSGRQRALVLDWCAPLLSPTDRQKLAACSSPDAAKPTHFIAARDCLFQQIAAGTDVQLPTPDFLKTQFDWLIRGGFRDSAELYALCELISAARTAAHTDLRESENRFFANLPVQLLLAAKPRELETPDWQKHLASLALIAVDPNLPASQFLQGYSLEERQMITAGPGVAYELLWADPYLPGIGYQNAETFLYEDHGYLYARANWEPDSCWIEISPTGVKDENCPPNWRENKVVFGHLTLLPLLERCIDVPRVPNNQMVLVWRAKPGQTFRTSTADAAGIWRPGANLAGKVCAAR